MTTEDVKNDWEPSTKLAVFFLIPAVVGNAIGLLVIMTTFSGFVPMAIFLNGLAAVAWMSVGNFLVHPRWRKSWLKKMGG